MFEYFLFPFWKQKTKSKKNVKMFYFFGTHFIIFVYMFTYICTYLHTNVYKCEFKSVFVLRLLRVRVALCTSFAFYWHIFTKA